MSLSSLILTPSIRKICCTQALVEHLLGTSMPSWGSTKMQNMVPTLRMLITAVPDGGREEALQESPS